MNSQPTRWRLRSFTLRGNPIGFNLFDPFAPLQTHGIARMAGGPSVNRTRMVRCVLGNMGRDPHRL